MTKLSYRQITAFDETEADTFNHINWREIAHYQSNQLTPEILTKYQSKFNADAWRYVAQYRPELITDSIIERNSDRFGYETWEFIWTRYPDKIEKHIDKIYIVDAVRLIKSEYISNDALRKHHGTIINNRMKSNYEDNRAAKQIVEIMAKEKIIDENTILDNYSDILTPHAYDNLTIQDEDLLSKYSGKISASILLYMADKDPDLLRMHKDQYEFIFGPDRDKAFDEFDMNASLLSKAMRIWGVEDLRKSEIDYITSKNGIPPDIYADIVKRYIEILSPKAFKNVIVRTNINFLEGKITPELVEKKVLEAQDNSYVIKDILRMAIFHKIITSRQQIQILNKLNDKKDKDTDIEVRREGFYVLRRIEKYMEKNEISEISTKQVKELTGNHELVSKLNKLKNGKPVTIEEINSLLSTPKKFLIMWDKYDPDTQVDPYIHDILEEVERQTMTIGFEDVSELVKPETHEFLIKEVFPSSHNIGFKEGQLGFILFRDLSNVEIDYEDDEERHGEFFENAIIIEEVQSDVSRYLPSLLKNWEDSYEYDDWEDLNDKYDLAAINEDIKELTRHYPIYLLTAFLSHYKGRRILMPNSKMAREITEMSPDIAKYIYDTTARKMGFEVSPKNKSYRELTAGRNYKQRIRKG